MMTIKNKNVGDKNRKISGKKIMLVTALLSGGVVIRVNNHINNSFGHAPKEVINFDLTLESTDVLIDDSGVFYVGQGTPIDNFNIYDFVTILDESGNEIPDSEVTLEWDVKEYFEGTTFGTEGEYLITITATTTDGRTGVLEYKLVVKEGHIFEEIKPIEDIEVKQTNKSDEIDFQEHFKVLNSSSGEEEITKINSTLVDEDLRTIGTKQIIFYTELDGTRFTNSVHISVVDTEAPVIELVDDFLGEGIDWEQSTRTINISELDKTLGDFTLDEYATAYDGSGEFELSWNFDEVMGKKLNQIGTETIKINAIDSSGNEAEIEIYVNISTVKFEFKDGISSIAFELFHDANINDSIYTPLEFYNVFDAAGNPIAGDRISWDLTEEMIREVGEYRLTIEVLDENHKELLGTKGVTVKVQDTLAPVATLVENAKTSFKIEVDQNISIDNIFMYLDGVSGIDELITVVENSGMGENYWGYRFKHNGNPITEDLLRTVGTKYITLELFDFDKEGNENNYTHLHEIGGNTPLNFLFEIVDTKEATVVITKDVINLEVVQNATKEMIEINNYAEISDNSGSFTWDLRIKGAPTGETLNYRDILGKITNPQGLELELVVTDASGNTTYRDMLLIVTDTQAPVFELKKDEETININPNAEELTNVRNIDSYVTVTDNSGKQTVDWDFDTVVKINKAGIYYVTITATDSSGNFVEQIIKFTVKDAEAPKITVNTTTVEIEANEYLNGSELEFHINLNDYITVIDNSGEIPTVTFDYSNVDFGEIGNYDVIITASDEAGNESTNIITIRVIAGSPKVRVVNDEVIIDTMRVENLAVVGIKVSVKDGKILIERAPQTSHAEVMSYLTKENLLEFLTITGETIESSTWDLSGIDFEVLGSNLVTLSATNNFGKTTTQTIEFVVIQEWDSILELKGDNFIDLEINTSEARDKDWFNTQYDVLNYVKLRGSLATANFSWDDTSISNIDFNNVGSNVITIWLADGAGNINEISLSFNVIDTTAATINAADTTTIEINEKDTTDYDVYNFVTVTDNSDLSTGSTVVLSWNLDTQVDFTKVGTYTVTIKAVDASGNVSTKDITFEVEDNNAPVLTINSGMDIQTIEINSRDESQFNVNSFVTAVDNSGVASELEWNIEDVDFTQTGTYTVTVRATDKAGNVSNEVTITFEVVDTIEPIIDIDPVGLEELKVEIDTKSETDYSDWLEDYVTVIDNSNEDITPTWDITSVDFGTVGSYMIVISATDSSNQTSTTNVVFAVADTTAPTITLKENMEVTEYVVLQTVGTTLNIDDFVDTSDSSGYTLSWDMSSVNFDRVGTYVVTIRAVDSYGNESIQEITLEVQDTTKPVIEITRSEILVSMGKQTSSDYDVNDFAKVTDNYDKSVVLTWDIDSVDFNAEGDNVVTIKAVDMYGNEAGEKEVIFKVEEINIVLTEVAPFEIEINQSADATAVLIETYFTAIDGKGNVVEKMEWDLTDEMLKKYGSHAVTLTITFDGGNVVEMEVTLQVIDTVPPVVTVDVSSATIELGDLTEYDNLNPEDFVTVDDESDIITYSWDLDGVVEKTIAGTYLVTITVADAAGNETEVTVDIVVVDTIDPTLELNDDFDRNNMVWSKANKELSILAGDKTQAEIDLWELVTGTDASTTGLTIEWTVTDLDTPNNLTGVVITVTDVSGNSTTETISVTLLKPTPILNNFSVDKTYGEVIVDVDLSNLIQAISGLEIILQDVNGTELQRYTELDLTKDDYSINHVFTVSSNTEYIVVLEYKYETGANSNATTTITNTENVKTFGYSESDVLGTITNVKVNYTEVMINYEMSDPFSLIKQKRLLIKDENGTLIEAVNITSDIGNYTFVGLSPNTNYRVEIEVIYDFNDNNGDVTKVTSFEEIKTNSYNENNVILDITGISQSTTTVSVDYAVSDSHGLITLDGLVGKIYNAKDMSLVGEIILTDLSGTVKFENLDANTSFIVVIEAELDLKDGSIVSKEVGSQATTDSYNFDEITVNLNNVVTDYDEITFDYEIFDPNGLMVGNKFRLVIEGQVFELTQMSGTINLSTYVTVNSGSQYDVEIHFDYNLKDGNGDIKHETNLYGFVGQTTEYILDQDLTLTSHNLGSDTSTIYVDYSLRNLNLIGDMSTLSVTIRDENNNEQKILFSTIFGDVDSIPLEGDFKLDAINGNILQINTTYEIEIAIDYDLNDGNGIQRNLLLLDKANIQTKDFVLSGYNVITSVDRGYNFLDVDFEVFNSTVYVDLLDSFKVALLNENNEVVPGYDYNQFNATIGMNNIRFENLSSDASYTIVYRIDNPAYVAGNGEDEFVEITRSISTRTYDTDLITVDYDLKKGYTYLQLENINIVDSNIATEGIEYSKVVVKITYTTRDGNLITEEVELGSLTEVVFSGLESGAEIDLEFRIEYDLFDGKGPQTGTDSIFRNEDVKTQEYDFTFVIENDEVIVTGLTPGFNKTELVIFEEVEGYTVKSVREDSFYSNTISFDDVVLPETIESIGENAFRNVSLTAVKFETVFEVIPGVSTPISDANAIVSLVVHDNAFRDNSLSVFDFTITTSIGDNAFRNNALTEVLLPDNVSYVGSEAFSNNDVTKLTTGALLSENNFGSNSFTGNKINNLTIGNIGFKHDSLGSSELVFSTSGFVLTFADTAVGKIEEDSWRADNLYPTNSKAKITDLYIGNGIDVIGDSAFVGNALDVVVVGDSVTTIESFAFESATVKDVTLGASIVTIEEGAFRQNEISVITLPNSLDQIGNYAFANNKIDSLVLDSNISYIDSNAFANNDMTKLTIGDTLTQSNFGSNTFVGNKIDLLTLNNINITHSTFGSSANVFSSTGYGLIFTDEATGDLANASWEFGTSSNSSKVKMTSLSIGNGITNIGDYVFYGNSLSTVVIGNNVETIGSSAFDSTEIDDLTLGNSISELGKRSFAENNIMEIKNFPQSLEIIGDGAFISNNIKILSLPNTVQTIGVEAFRYNQMENLTLAEGISPAALMKDAFAQNVIGILQLGNPEFINTSFGESERVFSPNGVDLVYTDGASGTIPTLAWDPAIASPQNPVFIKSLDLGRGITEISQQAFNFSSITELFVPNNIQFMGRYAFANNPIDKLTVEEGVTSSVFGERIFALSHIKELILGDVSLTNETFGIGEYRSLDVNGVKVTYTDGAVGQIPANAWNNNRLIDVNKSQVKELTLGDGITGIGDSAFANNDFDNLVLGKDLETIGNNAFQNNGILTATFNDSLGTIGTSAFQGNTIAVVELENTAVTEIGNSAFRNIGINTLTLSDELTTISELAFANNSIANVELKGLVTTIGDSAFDTAGLQTLILRDGIDSIGRLAFANNAIVTLEIPSNVQTIGDNAFINNSLKEVLINENTLASAFGTNVFTGTNNKINKLGISDVKFNAGSFGVSSGTFDPNGVDLTYLEGAKGEIASQAWFSRDFPNNVINIETLVLGEGITAINHTAFDGAGVQEVTIGKNIERVEIYAFSNNNLKKVTIAEGVPASIFAVDAFAANSINELVLGDPSFTAHVFNSNSYRGFDSNGLSITYMDGAVGEIPANAWNKTTYPHPTNVTSLTLGDGLTAIGDSAFANNSFEDVVLGKDLETIGNSAFASSGIRNVTFNDSLITIGSSAFEGNTISTVDLSNTAVQTIGSSAFKSVGVQTLTLGDSVETIGDSAFESNNITDLVLTDSVETLGSSVFKNTGLSTVMFNDGLTTIGQAAFEGNSLTDVIMFNSVVSLGASAFKNNSIANYTLSDKITVFNTSVFENNEIDTLVLLPHVTDVFDSAFAGNNISSMIIPSSIDSVGNNAFNGNDITELVIADGLSASQFGSNSFENNEINKLTVGNIDFKHNTFGASQNVFASTGFELVITNAASGQIIDNAWEYSTASSTSNVKLTGVSIGDGITSIGNSAFFGNDLSTVVVGSGVVTIGSNAFDSTGVSDLTLGASIVTLGYRSFANNQLTEIKNFPQTLETIGDGAFINNKINVLSLPNTVKSIGVEAFRYNQMTNLTLAEGIAPSALKLDAFSQNEIAVLQLGNPEFTNTSFGTSHPVFSTNGIDLVYTDGATGTIPYLAWDPAQASPNNPMHVISLDLGRGITGISQQAFNFSSISELFIPNQITSIGLYAFANNKIPKLVVEEGVKASVFGDRVFALCDLQDITLGDVSLTNETFGIGQYRSLDANGVIVRYSDGATGAIPANAWNNGRLANENKSQVKELVLGAGITSIGDSAFANNDFDDVTLTEKITTIGNSAFGSSSIENVTFNDSLMTIGNNAFQGNTISTVDLSNTVVETIGNSAFYDVGAQSIVLSDETRIIGNSAFENVNHTKPSINLVISDDVEIIGSSAFKNAGITGLTLSEGLTTIGDSAFENNSIGTLFLPTTVDTIGSSAFKNAGITGLTLNEGLVSIASSAFETNSIVDLVLPSTVTSIGSSAFRYAGITNGVTLNDGLTTIGSYAFANNTIVALDLNDSIQTVGESAFNTVGMQTLTLHDGLDTIGSYAFANNSLTTLEIPSNVTRVDDNAFTNNSITELTVNSGTAASAFGTDVFTGTNNKFTILNVGDVGFGTRSFGTSSSTFDSNGLILTYLPGASGEIPTNAWWSGSAPNNRINITELNLGSGITSIKNSAFDGSGVKEVTFGKNITNVSTYAFSNNNLKKVTIEEGVTAAAFQANVFAVNVINEITFGDPSFTGSLFGTSQFRSLDTSGVSITYTDGATGAIPNNAWNYSSYPNASKITSLTLGAGITGIGTSSFANNNLGNLELKDDIETIGNEAFRYSGITSLTLNEGLINIGNYAFANNVIPSLQITSTVRTIGVYAFNTNEIAELVLGKDITSIEEYAFSDNKLVKITTEEGLKPTAFGTNLFARTEINELILGDASFTAGSFGLGWRALDANGYSVTYTSGVTGAIPANAWNSLHYVSGIRSTVSSVTFSDGITSIGDSGFANNDLTDVQLPNSLQTIGNSGFTNNDIVTVNFNDLLESIGSSAFSGNSITNVDLEDTKVESIGASAFVSNGVSTLKLNDDIVSIGGSAFENSSIGDLTLPTDLVTLGTAAFKNAGITGLTLNDDLVTIGDSAFQTNSIESLVLTDSVETIGNSAFNSAGITLGVTFNDGLVTIGNSAFSGNTITTIDLKDTVTSIGANAFDSVGLTTLTIQTGLKTIGNAAFANNVLTGLTIPAGVTTVGSNAFSNNTILKLTVDEGTEPSAFGTDVFSGNRMNELVLGHPGFVTASFATSSRSFTSYGVSLTYTDGAIGAIPSRAFDHDIAGHNAINFTSLHLGSGITRINDRVFNFSKIGEVYIPSNVQYLGEYSFSNNGTTKLTLEPGITASMFGPNVFANCAIKDLYVGDASFTMSSFSAGWSKFDPAGFNLTYLDGTTGNVPSHAWYYASHPHSARILSLTLVEGMQSIGEWAYNYVGAQELIIPSTITSIGFVAFGNVITDRLVIREGVTASAFANDVFGLTSIKEVVLGDTSFTSRTFSTQFYVFDPNGITVTYTDGATGTIPDNAWNNHSLASDKRAPVTQLTLGAGITGIGASSFANNSLSEVTIPTAITSIANGGFHGNSALNRVIFNSGTVINRTGAFNSNPTFVDSNGNIL